jgi:hypothetical protein
MSSAVGTGIETVTGLLREQLPSGMVVTEPSAVSALIRLWNAQVTGRPAVAARCGTTADVQAAVRAASAESMPATCVLNVHHAHGAATRVPITQTAYAYRDEHLVVEIIGTWTHGDGAAESAWGWVRDTERRLDAHALPGGWANLMARGDQRARDAYGINTGRLLAVKSHYDPDEVFTAIPLPG